MLDVGGIQELCTVPGSCLGPALGVSLLETLPGGIRGERGVSWAFRDKKSKFSRRTAWEFRPREAPVGSEVKITKIKRQEKGGIHLPGWHGGSRGEDGWKQGWKYGAHLDGVRGIHPLHHHSRLHGTQPSPSLDPPVPCSHLKSSLSPLSQGALYSRLASVFL